MKPTRDASNTENQAAAWLVRLDAAPSARNLRHWRRWLSEDVRRHAAFVRLEQGWRQTDLLRSLRPLDSTVNPNLLDTFPGLAPVRGFRPKVAGGDLALQTLAVALAAALLACKLVWSCWLFINPGR